jgi:phosphoglycolate phosphatase
MNPLMPIRAVLFDLDGTLVDSLPGIEFSVDAALAACQLTPRSRTLRPLIGPPIRAIFSQLLPQAEAPQLSLLEQAFRRSYDTEGWTKTLLAPTARETLSAFRDTGLDLFVVTNKPSVPTLRILNWLNLREVFLDVICRDSQNPPFRSKADMLRHTLELHHLNPANCLYVGDTSEDYRAACDAALPVAIVSHGYGDPDASYPGAIRLDSLLELLPKLEVMEMS